ncbi:MAG: hypothetical protein VB078_11755 [Clostridiaceae bacterium]|nr:hypothetical protein [Clostridiaceae bacterium]
MKNVDLSNQCKTMLSSIMVFRQGVKMACLRNDGIIDKDEAKAMKAIEKKLVALEDTLKEIAEK